MIVTHGKYGKDFHLKCENYLKNLGEKDSINSKDIKTPDDNDVGCFFCSDYLPPTDTMTNRSLDQ